MPKIVPEEPGPSVYLLFLSLFICAVDIVRNPQDCWLLGRFNQKEKSSCKHRILRLSLHNIPGQSWSQDTLQGVRARTAGRTLLLQCHWWKTNEQPSRFI